MVTGQFNDSYPPIMDGVANVVRNYAHWLNRKYGKGYMITPSYPGYTDNDEFDVLRYFSVAVPMRPPYRLGIPQLDVSFKKRISMIPFDIVHAHCPFSSGGIALNIARKTGIPIVATFHSKYYDDFKAALKVEKVARYFTKKVIDFYNHVDCVWTVNKATVETMRSYGFKGNVEVVCNGTDFTPPVDSEKAADLVNRRLKIECDEMVLLFVGQHIWQKNLKMLVEALYHLKKMEMRFKMIFAGSGYAENHMKELVGKYQLDDSVRFLGTILDRDFLKSLFCRADLFVFPSLYDNAPIVVKEAACAGCPSLLVDGSNAAEGVVDNYNGFLSGNDAANFAQRIFEIAADREKLLAAGEKARETLFINWEQIADEVNGRYCDIIKSKFRKTR